MNQLAAHQNKKLYAEPQELNVLNKLAAHKHNKTA